MSTHCATRGFTLVEMLLATLLMGLVLAALATLTAQWLPAWNRGAAMLARDERIAAAMARLADDIAAAENIGIGDAAAFNGGALALTMLRSAIGPDARGLEWVHYGESADAQGMVLLRERAPFRPGGDLVPRFGGGVVLLRAPLRTGFEYAGPDGRYAPEWRGRPLTPERVRITLRDPRSRGASLTTTVALRIDLPPDCAAKADPYRCRATRGAPAEAATATGAPL